METTDSKISPFVPVIFTQRQVNIIKSWSKHQTIAEAAEDVGISEHTFNTHLKRMRKKLKVNRTFQVYLLLQQQKLI